MAGWCTSLGTNPLLAFLLTLSRCNPATSLWLTPEVELASKEMERR